MNIIIVGCGNIGYETAKLLVGNDQDNFVLLIDCYRPDYINDFLDNEQNVFFAEGDAMCPSDMDCILTNHTQFSKIDALICTVGSGDPTTPFDDFQTFLNCFELNVFGNLAPIKSILHKMISVGSGKLIVISSTSGHFAPLSLSAYAPAKWALECLCRSLRSEVYKYGISVDVIAPTTIRNKYSTTFKSDHGIGSSHVARKIVKILSHPSNSTHFIPMKYRFLHQIERLVPSILDIKLGLANKIARRKIYRGMVVNIQIL